MAVYIGEEYNSDKESEIGRDLYYYAVSIDIGAGLQKSFDETMEDTEQYMEEHKDEIEQAWEDYLN